MLKRIKEVLGRDTGITSRSWWLWGLLAFFVPFWLHYDYILNAFYHFGAGYGDSGLFARMVWQNKWWIPTPQAYASEDVSFMAIHFMPFMLVLNGLSYLIPTHEAEFYGVYMAAIYALLSAGLFTLFASSVRPKNQLQMAGLFIIASLYAFNYTVMEGIWYVHVEYAIPMCILFFLYFYIRRLKWPTIFSFIFLLSQREDAGFHLTAVLGLIAVVKWWNTRSFSTIRREAIYSYIAVIYSAFAMFAVFLIIDMYGGRDQSNWELMYTGREPWKHLTFAMLGDRLMEILRDRSYLYVGFFITMGWAVWKRDAYMAIGFVACLPWFVMNIIAYQHMNGVLSAYYGFPFVLGFGWPLIAVMLRYGFPLPAHPVREALILQVVLVLSSVLIWNNWDKRPEFGPYFGARWGSYTMQDGTINRQLTQQFVAQFEAGAGDLGIVAGEEGIMSLVWGTYHGKVMLRPRVRDKLDTMIYFTTNHGEVREGGLRAAWKNHLDNNYCMLAVPICMLTNRKLEQLGNMQYLFAPKELVKKYEPTEKDLKDPNAD